MKEAEVREIIGENKWDAFCEVNRFASLCIAEKI